MKVLDPEALAGAHDSAGIVGLENILKEHAEVIGPVWNDLGHAGPFCRADKL
jgi:hypothetical protein